MRAKEFWEIDMGGGTSESCVECSRLFAEPEDTSRAELALMWASCHPLGVYNLEGLIEGLRRM